MTNIDFRTTKLLRDKNGDPIPQLWDEDLQMYVPRTTFNDGGGTGGAVTQGPRGYSAYEIAVQGGFVGDEDAWLASLEGKDGEDGEPFVYSDFTPEQLEALRGPRGETGERGEDGKDFTHDDFTAEQLESLRGPAGVDGKDGADATLLLPLPARDIAQSSELQLISGEQKAVIETNRTAIESLIERLAQIEKDAQNGSATDELVKGDANDTAGFLSEKIDGTTIKWINQKLVVETIIGLMANVAELNALVGITGNVQAQLDAMLKVVNPKEIFQTKADLPALPNDTYRQGVTVLVQTDADYESATTFYMSNGNAWEYVNKINSDMLRDFLANPLNINTETTGTLEKSRYEKQNAIETPFTDPTGTLKSFNTQDAILELLRLADSAKDLIVVAIGFPIVNTDTWAQISAKITGLKTLFVDFLDAKKVGASVNNSLSELINKVPAIPNVSIESGVEKIERIRVTAPYTHEVVLNESLQTQDITTSLIEHVAGAQSTPHYDMHFNSADASLFLPNPDILFDGALQINPVTEREMMRDTSWAGEGELYRYTVIRDEWQHIEKIEVGE